MWGAMELEPGAKNKVSIACGPMAERSIKGPDGLQGARPNPSGPAMAAKKRLSFRPRQLATPRCSPVFLPPKPRQQQDQETSQAHETIRQDAIHKGAPCCSHCALTPYRNSTG